MTETKTRGGAAVATRPGPPLDAEEAVAELAAQATTPQDRERAFLILDAVKQSRLVRSMAAVVGATEWGSAMSATRQAAFAKYCLALGADPLRHVDLLGGNPFINGDYFRDVIAANPNFLGSDDPVWIHDDPRLLLCASCGKAFDDKPDHGHAIDEVTTENRRRLVERISRSARRVDENADEQSPSICILLIRYKDARVFKGLGEVHSGRTVGGKDRDPIGLASPRATAETRAWREAGEKAEATWFRTHASVLKQLEVKVQAAYAAERTSAEPEAREPEPIASEDAPRLAAVSGAGEPLPVTSATEVMERVEAKPANEAPPAMRAKIEQHQPTKMCPREGLHAREECGYHKPKGGEG